VSEDPCPETGQEFEPVEVNLALFRGLTAGPKKDNDFQNGNNPIIRS
jgi:hypothetical protein